MMDPSAPRVVVVGAGRMGMHHIRAMLRNSHLALAGILELDLIRCADLRSQVSCPVDSDFARLVDHVAPDGAIVATPDTTHLEISLQALDLGLHLLVEKPLAPTLQSAQHLIEHAQRRGRILRDGLVERFNPAWGVFLEHAARVGTPRRLEITRLGRRAPHPESGILLDLAIHDLDLLHLWLGRIPSRMEWNLSADDGTAALSVEHPFPIQLHYAWDFPATQRRWMLEGDAGLLDVDLGGLSATFLPCGGVAESIPVPRTDALESEHQAFRNAILLGDFQPCALRRHMEILSLLTGSREGVHEGSRRSSRSS